MVAAPERLELLRSRGQDACARFYDLWTLKESYIEARGTGLGSINLSKITFASVDGRIAVLSPMRSEPVVNFTLTGFAATS
jgi:phosphopantetheinyl transferase